MNALVEKALSQRSLAWGMSLPVKLPTKQIKTTVTTGAISRQVCRTRGDSSPPRATQPATATTGSVFLCTLVLKLPLVPVATDRTQLKF
jgi:hypothetical protein